MTGSPPLTVLCAEDDPDDRLLATMAHRDSGVANPLVFVADGIEVMEYLRASGRHADRADATRPGIVLLDLNMPGMDGFETLWAIRADPVLRRIPVVVLTTSNATEDITASYGAGANSYIVKPSSFAGLVDVFTRLGGYWFGVCSLAGEVTS